MKHFITLTLHTASLVETWRPEIELTEWNLRNIVDLKGSDLLWSTVEEEKGKAKCVKSENCALCHKSYSGGPFLIEITEVILMRH